MSETMFANTPSFESLASKFPNLVHSTAGSDVKDEALLIERCAGLITVAEMFELEDKVVEIAAHGSVPVLLFSVGKREDGGNIVKKVFNHKTQYGHTLYDTFEFENWDPHDYPEFIKLSDFFDNPEGFSVSRAAGSAGGNWLMTMEIPTK